MSTLAHDAPRVFTPSRTASGLGFALLAALSFGLSGSLARSLLDIGWSAGAATLVRVTIGSLALAVPGFLALRGQWRVLRAALPVVLVYGLFAVAGAQLCYFMAVGHLDVSIALLIEYTAPVAVVVWMWFRHGHRPTRLTVGGAALAAAGLLLLLDVLGGGRVSMVGVGWALAAMIGASVYFIVGADESIGLPPLTLAATGLVVAVVVLGIAGVVGILPMHFTAGDVTLAGGQFPWWLAALGLGVITAALAYTTGIAATRRLGARLGSFVALTEVLAAAIFAWALLGQAPHAMQYAGAALVLAGVIAVKMGEPKEDAVIVPAQPVEPVPA